MRSKNEEIKVKCLILLMTEIVQVKADISLEFQDMKTLLSQSKLEANHPNPILNLSFP